MKPLLKLLTIRKSIMMPVIMVLCMVGTYAIAGRRFDVLVMIAFGLMGFPMRKLGYPEAPFVLGIILGPMVDENLRRGMILSHGSAAAFFVSPISIVLMVLTFLTLFGRGKPVRLTLTVLLHPLRLALHWIAVRLGFRRSRPPGGTSAATTLSEALRQAGEPSDKARSLDRDNS